MKKIIIICAAILMTASVFAQAPEKMSYQAVVRDGSNNLISSTAVGMQISILQGSASGTAVYIETQTPTSNANGLVSLEIGSGTVVSGTFATIDWANGPYFIKTETDPTGGTSYNITGTSELLSVPYALYAKNTLNDNAGNSIMSFSKDTIVTGSYKNIDTIEVKANRVVTMNGYAQSTGSQATVYLYDLTNGQWLNNTCSIYTIYQENGSNNTFVGTNGAIIPFSVNSRQFVSQFIPPTDLTIIVRSKELSASAGDGVGECAVIVIQ
jgi:hypothetical protein